MADVIKRIKTSSGLKQIDYQSLANKNHANDHASNGSDPITPDMIGAASKEYVDQKIGSSPALTMDDFTFSTTDPGAGSAATTKFYVVYEE